MSLYHLRASGCDDATEVLLELTDTEAATVQQVAERITATSRYACMPRVAIRLATPEDIDEVEAE